MPPVYSIQAVEERAARRGSLHSRAKGASASNGFVLVFLFGWGGTFNAITVEKSWGYILNAEKKCRDPVKVHRQLGRRNMFDTNWRQQESFWVLKRL